MTPTLTGAMAARLGMRSLVFRTLAASLATNVLLGCALLLRTPPALTILVPPGAGTTEDGWAFTNDAPDSRYLERHALSLVSMLTNITPRTMEGSLARLLEHVAPESYGAMEKRLMREIASLKKDMASVAFYPSRTRTDANALSVTVFGERKLRRDELRPGRLRSALPICGGKAFPSLHYGAFERGKRQALPMTDPI